MAVVYVTGGEVGLSVTAGGGLALSSPSPSNSSLSQIRVKSGSYAYRVNHAASAIGVRAFVNVAASTANGGFWFYLETLPSADAKLFTIQGATNEDMVIQYDQGTGKLAGLDPVNGQIGIYTSCPVLSADTWYWIAWKSDRSANQLSITITPDGGSATDCGALTNATGWTANNGWVAIGNDTADVAVDFYIDDIIICSGTSEYPLAPHEVLLLQPGSDGTHNVAGTEYIASSTATSPNFTNSSTTVWQELDDLPWSTTLKTSGGVWCEVHSAGTYLEIAPATAASGKPDATAVRTILGYGSASTTANNGSAAVIRDSAASETTIRGNFTTGADYSESSTFFNGVMVPAPAGGWTKTEIEALRWRIGRASNSSDISPRPSWQVLGLEIAYPLSTLNNYVLNADPGSVALTGVAAGALAGRIVNADPGSIAVTGVAAGVPVGRVLLAAPGSVSVAGVAAGVLATRVLLAEPGSVALTGVDALLARGLVLIAAPGNVDLTGIAASPLVDRVLFADPGVVALTGVDAELLYQTALNNYVLNADPGSIAITGIAAGIAADRVLKADPGSVVVTGVASALLRDYVLSADPGSVSVNGIAALLDYSGGTPVVAFRHLFTRRPLRAGMYTHLNRKGHESF